MQLYAACNTSILDKGNILMVNKHRVGYNHIQDVHLGKYIIGYKVKKSRFTAQVTHHLKIKFPTAYFTSPKENFEYNCYLIEY